MMTRTINLDSSNNNYNSSNLGEIYSKLLVYSAFDLIESAPFTYLPLWLKASNQQNLGEENKQTYGLLQAVVASTNGGSGSGVGDSSAAAALGGGIDRPLNFYSLVFHVFYKHYQRLENDKH